MPRNAKLALRWLPLPALAVAALGVEMGWVDASVASRPEQIAAVILIFAATLWITELVPLFVTSLAILASTQVWLLPALDGAGIEATRGDFTGPFFSDVILLFLGGFTLAAAMGKERLDERLAQAVIERTGGSLPRLLLGLMAVTAFLSMWLSNTATTAMVLSLSLPIARSLPPGDLGRKSLVLAIPFAANIGGLGTPIGSPPNAIAVQYVRDAGFGVGFGTWMLVAIPIVLLLLAIAWAILVFRFPSAMGRVPPGPDIELDPDRAGRRAVVLVVTLVTVAGWLTGGLHGLSPGTVALLPVLVLFGGRLLDTRDLRSLSWDVLLLMGGGLCLGRVIETSGLAALLVANLPIDGASPLVIGAAFGCLACAMSLVMSNTAAANLLMPIALGIGLADPTPLAIGIAFSCSVAMALPISTPPNAIAFSSGQIAVKDLIRPGAALTVVGVIATFTLGAWWLGVVTRLSGG